MIIGTLFLYFQTLRDSLWKARDDAAAIENKSTELVKEAKKGTKVCMHACVVAIVVLVCYRKEYLLPVMKSLLSSNNVTR